MDDLIEGSPLRWIFDSKYLELLMFSGSWGLDRWRLIPMFHVFVSHPARAVLPQMDSQIVGRLRNGGGKEGVESRRG